MTAFSLLFLSVSFLLCLFLSSVSSSFSAFLRAPVFSRFFSLRFRWRKWHDKRNGNCGKSSIANRTNSAPFPFRPLQHSSSIRSNSRFYYFFSIFPVCHQDSDSIVLSLIQTSFRWLEFGRGHFFKIDPTWSLGSWEGFLAILCGFSTAVSQKTNKTTTTTTTTAATTTTTKTRSIPTGTATMTHQRQTGSDETIHHRITTPQLVLIKLESIN